jgi:uncharacterized membrane protein/thiol-disulfide isomerase/thioredoxin
MKTCKYLITRLWLVLFGLGVLAILSIPVTAYAQSEEKAIIYLFWGEGCPHCAKARPILQDLAQRYPNVELREYEIYNNPENREVVLQMAQSFGFEPRYVPTIFLGERYWEGFSDGILSEIETTLAACLETGCPDAGQGVPLPNGQSGQSANVPMQSNGFTLAVIVMIGMVAALVYSGVSVRRGLPATKNVRSGLPATKKTKSQKASQDFWLNLSFIGLCLVGLGVASYLAYVETQAVPAVCGPVGDCNAVQSSPYARLFGLLPIGVLGMLGYLTMLAAWLYPRIWHNRYAKYMPIVVFSMAFLGVLFSLYLTFLEPFVIKAVCAWCITSAVIMTLLLLLSLKPASQALKSLK